VKEATFKRLAESSWAYCALMIPPAVFVSRFNNKEKNHA
jgi:hypothetical protein